MLALLLLFMTATNPNTAAMQILASFESPGENRNWYTVHDNVMGGRSLGEYRINSGTLAFYGELNTNGGGFASIRNDRVPRMDTPYDTVVLRVRGDGRTYKMRLMTPQTRETYTADFTTTPGLWLEIALPLNSFTATWRGRKLTRPPITYSDITGFGLMIADRKDGAFRLEVDWIGLTRTN